MCSVQTYLERLSTFVESHGTDKNSGELLALVLASPIVAGSSDPGRLVTFDTVCTDCALKQQEETKLTSLLALIGLALSGLTYAIFRYFQQKKTVKDKKGLQLNGCEDKKLDEFRVRQKRSPNTPDSGISTSTPEDKHLRSFPTTPMEETNILFRRDRFCRQRSTPIRELPRSITLENHLSDGLSYDVNNRRRLSLESLKNVENESVELRFAHLEHSARNLYHDLEDVADDVRNLCCRFQTDETYDESEGSSSASSRSSTPLKTRYGNSLKRALRRISSMKLALEQFKQSSSPSPIEKFDNEIS